jgi:hypothetical protein
MNKNLITVEGSELIAKLEYDWVTFAYLGSHGLSIDTEEWDGFVELVKVVDLRVKAGKQ